MNKNSNNQTYVQLFQERLKYFYFEEFEDIIRRFKRGPLLSIFLKILYATQLISLMFTTELSTVIKSRTDKLLMDPLIMALNATKFFPLMDMAFSFDDSITFYIFITFGLNLIFIFYTIVRLVLRLNNSQIKRDEWFLYDEISSAFFQFYLKLFAIPFCEVCIRGLYSNASVGIILICVINISLTIMVGITITMHDFDYCFIIKDFLAKRESLAGIIFFLQDMILVAVANSDLGQVILWIHIIFIGTRIFDFAYEIPYYYKPVSLVYLQMNITHFSIAIISLILDLELIPDVVDIGLIFLSMIPPSFKFGATFRQYIVGNIELIKQENITSPTILDLYVRSMNELTMLDYHNYCREEKGILFEAIFTRHIENCEIAGSPTQTCYCERFQKSELDTEELIEQNYRKAFMVFYIINTYMIYFEQNKKQEEQAKLRFSQVAFLIEIFNVPSKALTEVMFMKVINTSATYKEKYQIHSLARQSELAFFSFFHNSVIQNQRLDMMSVMEFDMHIRNLDQDFKQALIDKRDFFVFLCQDFIDLEILDQKGQVSIKKRDDIENKIFRIFVLNPNSKKCIELALLYVEYFDVKMRKPKHFMNYAQIKRNALRIKEDIDVDLFSQQSCVVFCTLLKPLGYIKRVTTSFINLFQMPCEEALDRSCNFIMPENFGKHHDRFLDWFLQNDRMKAITKGTVFNFGIRGDGFIFSLIKRLRLDTFEDDYGVTAYLLETNKNYDYILTDQYNRVIELTEKVYNYCFKRFFEDDNSSDEYKRSLELRIKRLKKLRLIDAGLMIPFIHSHPDLDNPLEEEDPNNTFMTSIMIFPLSNESLKYFMMRPGGRKNKLKELLENLDFQNFGMMEVTFRKCIQVTSVKGVNFYYIEIQNQVRLRKSTDKLEKLRTLCQTMNNFFKCDISLQKKKNLVVQVEQFEDSENKSMAYNNTAYYENLDTHFISRTLLSRTKQSKKDNNNNATTFVATINPDNNKHKDELQMSIIKSINSQERFESVFNENIEHKDQGDSDSKQVPNKSQIGPCVPLSKFVEDQNQSGMQLLQFTNTNENLLTEFDQQKIQLLTQNSVQKNQDQMLNSKQQQQQIAEDFQNLNNLNHSNSPKHTLIPQKQQIQVQQQQQEKQQIKSNFLEKQISSQLESEEQRESALLEQISNLQNGSNPADSQVVATKNLLLQQLQTIHEEKAKAQNQQQEDQEEQQQNQNKPNEQGIGSQYTSGTERSSALQTKEKKELSNNSMENNKFEDEMEVRNKMERSSVNSSSSGEMHTMKKTFLEILQSKNYPRIIRQIIVIGLFGLVVLAAIVASFFFAVRANFKSELNDFNNIVVSANLQASFAQIIKDTEFLRLNSLNLLERNMTQEQSQQVKQDSLQQIDEFKGKISLFMNADKNFGYKQYLSETQEDLVIYTENKQTLVIRDYLMYFFIQASNYAYQYVTTDHYESRLFLYRNFVTYVKQIDQIYESTHKDAQKELETTNTLLFSSFFVTLGFVIIFISMFIPFYSNIQGKCEEILKLFGTYPEDKLKEQIIFNQTAFDLLNSNIDNRDMYMRRAMQYRKRRTISHTSSLKRYEWKLVIACSIMIIIASIYPVINFVITNDFLTEFGYNIQELSLVYSMRGIVALNYAVNYLRVSLIMQKMDEFFPIVDDFLIELQHTNDQRMDKLQMLEQNFQTINRYGVDEYKNIFLKALQVNICDTLEKNQQYFDLSRLNIDFKECRRVYDGIMKKGLIMTLSNMYTIFIDLKQTYNIKDPTLYRDRFSYWDKNYDTMELDRVYIFMDNIIEMLRDFLLMKSYEYYNYQSKVQIWLFIYALFIIFFVMAAGLYYFIQYMANSLFRTRYLLGMFTIDVIMANPYMKSLMEKERQSRI